MTTLFHVIDKEHGILKVSLLRKLHGFTQIFIRMIYLYLCYCVTVMKMKQDGGNQEL